MKPVSPTCSQSQRIILYTLLRVSRTFLDPCVINIIAREKTFRYSVEVSFCCKQNLKPGSNQELLVVWREWDRPIAQRQRSELAQWQRMKGLSPIVRDVRQ